MDAANKPCRVQWVVASLILFAGFATAQTETTMAPLAAPEVAPVAAPEAAAEPPAMPLPLPDSPDTVCTAKTFHEAASKAPSCSQTMLNYETAVKPCCDVLNQYYGVNSTLPSRNCFCVDHYWTRLTELDEITYIGLEAYITTCNDEFNATIAYYQDGEGPCAGLEAADYDYEPAPTPSARSLGQWVHDLDNDGLMIFSFTLGLISAVGFVAMLWPLASDSLVQIHKMRSKRQ